MVYPTVFDLRVTVFCSCNCSTNDKRSKSLTSTLCTIGPVQKHQCFDYIDREHVDDRTVISNQVHFIILLPFQSGLVLVTDKNLLKMRPGL